MPLIYRIIKRNQLQMLLNRRPIAQIRDHGGAWFAGDNVTAWFLSTLRRLVHDLMAGNMMLRRQLPHA